MDCRDTDVTSDPCAIIARSICGTAIFFAAYATLAVANGEMQHGFWLSLCLGLIGCMAISRNPQAVHPAPDTP